MSWMLSCIGCGSKKLAEKEEAKVLDFQHYSLTAVPPYVFECERCLEELYLDCNQIAELPRELFLCNELQILTLSDNDLHNIPTAISSLSNLTSLDISKNGISDIPDSIKSCKRLRIVNANTNPLCRLPEGFTQLVALRELSLSDTFLEYLPANFGRLSGLEVLELRENQLNTLPRSMTRLSSLKRLDLGQNEFTELPEVVGHLTSLTDLWIDNNRIKRIPPEIGNLIRLSFVDASKNRLNEIDPGIGECKSLSDFYLTRNELDELPPSICRCTKLTNLHIDDNHLDHLPDDIGCLDRLVELKISQNELPSLPSSVGLLRSLQFLHVDENLLSSLPGELGSCVSLIVITAAHNNISEVPAEMGSLPSLRVVNLCGNSIQDLPVSFTKLQLTALWLSENQAKPSVPLQCINNSLGHKVLTCFMLPQSLTQSPPPSTRPDDDRPITEAEIEARLARSSIHFASDGDQKAPGRLSRVPTPYPKELRALAKHTKNILALKKEKDKGDVTSKEKSVKESTKVSSAKESLVTVKTSSAAVKVASTVASDSAIKSSQQVTDTPRTSEVSGQVSDTESVPSLCQKRVPTPPSSPPPTETPTPVSQGDESDAGRAASPSFEKGEERHASFIVSRPPARLQRDSRPPSSLENRKVSPPSVGLSLFKPQSKTSPITPPPASSPTTASTVPNAPTSLFSPVFITPKYTPPLAALPLITPASISSSMFSSPTIASTPLAPTYTSPISNSTSAALPDPPATSTAHHYTSDGQRGATARPFEPQSSNLRPASIAVAETTSTSLGRGSYSNRPGSLALEGIMPPWQNQRPGSLAAPINTVGIPMPLQGKRASSQGALYNSSTQKSPQFFAGRTPQRTPNSPFQITDDYMSPSPKEQDKTFNIRSNGSFLGERSLTASPDKAMNTSFDTYGIEEESEIYEQDPLLEQREKNGLVSIIDQVTEEDIDEETSLLQKLSKSKTHDEQNISKIPTMSPMQYQPDTVAKYNHSVSPPSSDGSPSRGLISPSGIAVLSKIPHVSTTKVAQITSPKVLSPSIGQNVPVTSPSSSSRIPPPSYVSPLSPTTTKITPDKAKSFIPKFEPSLKKETTQEIKKPTIERQLSGSSLKQNPQITPTRDTSVPTQRGVTPTRDTSRVTPTKETSVPTQMGTTPTRDTFGVTPTRDNFGVTSTKETSVPVQKGVSSRIPTFSSPTGSIEAKDQSPTGPNSSFIRSPSQIERESFIPVKKTNSNPRTTELPHQKQQIDPPVSPVEKPINQTGIPILSPSETYAEKSSRIPSFSNSSLRGRKSAVPVVSQKGLRYQAGGK